uniref:TF_AP-2 domain-containing protein n=1 Tax=Angiostrongylus cantonensis TaxID=6313 RepID=A0A0K0CVV8_ANGCA
MYQSTPLISGQREFFHANVHIPSSQTVSFYPNCFPIQSIHPYSDQNSVSSDSGVLSDDSNLQRDSVFDRGKSFPPEKKPTTSVNPLEVFDEAPGRLCLLNASTKYKTKDGCKMLRDRLAEKGISLPSGRRKTAPTTSFTALCESRRYLAGIMAIFDEVPEDPEDYVEKDSATHSINIFSMLTHGFGHNALKASLRVFGKIVDQQHAMLQGETYDGHRNAVKRPSFGHRRRHVFEWAGSAGWRRGVSIGVFRSGGSRSRRQNSVFESVPFRATQTFFVLEISQLCTSARCWFFSRDDVKRVFLTIPFDPDEHVVHFARISVDIQEQIAINVLEDVFVPKIFLCFFRARVMSHPPEYAAAALRSTPAQMTAGISVDLVVAAQREANFLRMIDRKAPLLYEPDVINQAIRRYETCWLPMQVEKMFNRIGSRVLVFAHH